MTLRVGIVGCGLIGARRAGVIVSDHRSALALVADSAPSRGRELAAQYHCRVETGWREVVDDPEINAVVVSTPNGFTLEIAAAALAAGKHVLVEKPPGRNLAEAQELARRAQAAGRILKVGFNHRYHPALFRARELFGQGLVGELINVRARYGHGGRPGYEKEWRGSPELAGGGELTDQGVHIADLINWFGGLPQEAFALLQTAVWPIQPLEDNAFGLLRFASGAVASVHTSWTQWKNLFSFEVFGRLGSLTIDGLGGSYGAERLITSIRNPQGGIPQVREELFEGSDHSWELEWQDFLGAVLDNRPYLGTPADGIAAMTIIDGLYRSGKSGMPVRLVQS